MNQVLTKIQTPVEIVASELHRVVNDFVQNATDEDVARLLERASVGFDSRVETISVLTAEPPDLAEYAGELQMRATEAVLEGELYTEALNVYHFSAVRALSTGSAADRNDLALAA